MSKDAIETKLKEAAEKDVVGFASLTVEGKHVGSQMLQELQEFHVLWHPEKERYFLLPKCTGKPLKRFWNNCGGSHTWCSQPSPCDILWHKFTHLSAFS